MFTDEEIKILKEIAANYKQEQLNLFVVRQRALEWWQQLRETCVGHSDSPTKDNYAYKYHKCHYKGLSEEQIIEIWRIHAIK